MTDKKKKPNKLIKRFEPRMIQGGEIGPEPEPKRDSVKESPKISASDLASKLKDLDPKKVKEFDKIIQGMFKAIQANDDPKMFQCGHCGGFHSFDVHCSVCDKDNKAQQAFVMQRVDQTFAIAMCKQCFAVSIAIFQCRGIDPNRADLQKEFAESAKAGKPTEPGFDGKS